MPGHQFDSPLCRPRKRRCDSDEADQRARWRQRHSVEYGADSRQVYLIGDEAEPVTTVSGKGTAADPVTFFEWMPKNVTTSDTPHAASLISDDDDIEDFTLCTQFPIEENETITSPISTLSSIELEQISGQDSDLSPFCTDHAFTLSSVSPGVSPPSSPISTREFGFVHEFDDFSGEENDRFLTPFSHISDVASDSSHTQDSAANLAYESPISLRTITPISDWSPISIASVILEPDSTFEDEDTDLAIEKEDGEPLVDENQEDFSVNESEDIGHFTVVENRPNDHQTFSCCIVIDCGDENEDEEFEIARISSQIPRWEDWPTNSVIKSEPSDNNVLQILKDVDDNQTSRPCIVVDDDGEDEDTEVESELSRLASQIPLWEDWPRNPIIKPEPTDHRTSHTHEKTTATLLDRHRDQTAPPSTRSDSEFPEPPIRPTGSPQDPGYKEQLRIFKKDKTIFKKRLFYRKYYKNMLPDLVKRFAKYKTKNVAIPSTNPSNSCHLYTGHVPIGPNNLQFRVRFVHNSVNYELSQNLGAINLLLNNKLSREAIDGYVYDGWHISHLCGNWRCTNVNHVRPEPAHINLDRNKCLRPKGEGRRRMCDHVPECLVDLTVPILEQDKARGRGRGLVGGRRERGVEGGEGDAGSQGQIV